MVLPWDFISKHLDKNWSFDSISRYTPLTIDIIRKNKDRIKWNWTCLTLNRSFTFEDFKSNLDLPWDISRIILNDNLTLKNNQDLIPLLSARGVISDTAAYEKNMYCYFPMNSNMRLEDLMQNKDKPWHGIIITSALPSFILKTPECMDPRHEIWNMFPWWVVVRRIIHLIHFPDILAMKTKAYLVREWFAINRICNAVFRAFTHPDYNICRKRIYREWEEFQQEEWVSQKSLRM